MNKTKLDKDFKSFENDELTPSIELDRKILSYVQSDLNPGHLFVFIKLLMIQGFIGTLTLLFCPQFNLSLTNNYQLFHYFHHRFGEYVCMMICGSIFIGSGAIFASYLLKNNEIKIIKNSLFLYFIALGLAFLSLFMLLGASFYLKLTTFWFFGAFLSGVLFFGTSVIIRQKIQAL